MAVPEMVISEPPVSESEKREALELALNSHIFARSAQLKAFLRYVCEMDLAGRDHELTEYQIGVEVLGRPKDAIVSDDSSVRNRAYEVRQRLEKFYLTEQPHVPVRIEIPRGGYVPRYVRQTEILTPVSPVEIPARIGGVRRASWKFGPLAVVGIAIACLVGGWVYGSLSARPHPPAIVAEAWGPMAEPGGEMLIAIATNLHMLIRPHIPPHPMRFPVPEALYPLFRTSRPLEDGAVLYMEPAQLSIPLGELAAATTLAETRKAFGGSYQILPESEAPIAALMGRNSVLIGTPVNSRAASILLAAEPLTMGFTAADQFAIIDQRKPAGQNQLFVAQPTGDPVATVLYGLLTVTTRADSYGKPKRIVNVTGTGSPGVQAAVEFFCSPDRMRDLKARFMAAGLHGFPPDYQLVVRCKTAGIRLLSYEYATHVVVQTPAEHGR